MATFYFTVNADTLSGQSGLYDDFVAADTAALTATDVVRAQLRDTFAQRDALYVVGPQLNETIAFTSINFPLISGIEIVAIQGAVPATLTFDNGFMLNNRARDGRTGIAMESSGDVTVSGAAITDPSLAFFFGDGLGNNSVLGTLGEDVFLLQSNGSDKIDGGAGNDFFYVREAALNNGLDTLMGGLGIDTIEIIDTFDGWSLTTGTGILANLSSVERFAFGMASRIDTAIPLTAAASLRALSVTDAYVSTLAGTTLEFEFGRATNGTSVIVAANGLTGSNAIRVVTNQSSDACSLYGGAAADTLLGGHAADVLSGGGGNNILHGGGGADTIEAGSGTSTVTGGSGADIFKVGAVGGTMLVQDPDVGDIFSSLALGTLVGAVTAGTGTSMAANTVEVGAPSSGTTPIYLRTTGTGPAEYTMVLPGTWVTTDFTLAGGNLQIVQSPLRLATPAATITGSVNAEGFTVPAGSLGAGDVITGGGGADWLQLLGTGSYDVSAATITGVPTIRGLDTGDVGSITIGGSWSGTYLDGAGNETIEVTGTSASTLFVGRGTDAVTLGAGTGHQVVVSGGGTTTVTLGSGSGTIFAGAINEGMTTIVGGSGTYTIVGGANGSGLSLNLSASSGNYTVFRPSNATTVMTGSGTDVIVGDEGNQSLSCGAGDDQLFGAGGDDTLTGGTGDDTIVGGDGADVFESGVGADTLFGGTGSDFFHIGFASGTDRALIADFSLAEGDRLNLVDLGFANQASFDAATTAQVVNGGVRYTITLGGSAGATIDLAGLTALLPSSAFIFV
ncbi:MAG: calcium-binding protein [Alphaproteobacteria bacterium]|nr:calcium-binding protein [Alphaproteobacteria bacterium]